MRIVAVSGGFDPLHPGHIDMIEAARSLGDSLIVLLNTDEFLIRKKGRAFMTWHQRARVVGSLRAVDMVVPVIDEDDTVCETLRQVRPTIFANGGDRFADNTPEVQICRDLGIEIEFRVGGGKVESSSQLLTRWETSQCR